MIGMVFVLFQKLHTVQPENHFKKKFLNQKKMRT
jgi:hypothetical protein